jgi:sec-independent protein translocase protein TatA
MKLRPSHFVVALTLALLLPSCTMPGGAELAIIALVVLLMFGGAKLPKLMRGMGSGITEFKKGLKEGDASDGDGDAAADDTADDESKRKSDED